MSSAGWRGLVAHWLPAPLPERLRGRLDPLLLALFEDASGAMLAIDPAGRILRANQAMRRLGAPEGDLAPGAEAAALFAADDRAPLRAMIAAGAAGRAPVSSLPAQLAVLTGDADHLLDVTLVPLREADGAIAGLLLRIVDQTPRRRLEAQLGQGQRLQAVGQLAGGIAHDFNNLLTTINGAAELVLERHAVDAETRDDVTEIRRSAARGAELVRRLLAFGRQQTLQPRVIAVNDAVQGIAAMLHRSFAADVRVALALEQPARQVRIDPVQLDQVLLNLAMNARDAMPAGGTLTLRTRHATLYRAAPGGDDAIPPGRYVVIDAIDTGEGIAPDVLPRIFDPFFTTKRDRGGSGLGLSMAHGIVRQSGGYIDVAAEPTGGTRFSVHLPRHEAREANITVAASVVPPPSPAPMTSEPGLVLLVDDEEPVRRLAARALSARGWRVQTADNAEAALASLGQPHEQRPALLISDVVMPGLDGVALVRAARAVVPGLPAVLISGYADGPLRAALEREDIAFLAKPYALRDLLVLAAQVVLVTPKAGTSDMAQPRVAQNI